MTEIRERKGPPWGGGGGGLDILIVISAMFLIVLQYGIIWKIMVKKKVMDLFGLHFNISLFLFLLFSLCVPHFLTNHSTSTKLKKEKLTFHFFQTKSQSK